MNDLSKTFHMYEHSPLDASVEVKKGGYIKVNQLCLNTVSASGTLIVL